MSGSNYFKRTKDEWDCEYKVGKWEYLSSNDESSRYILIRNICKTYVEKGFLLDLGCGEGLILDYMTNKDYLFYCGVDISNVAINCAKKRKISKSKIIFFNTKIENFYTPIKFDVIIFNEILYYLKNPSRVLNRYLKFLKKDGIIIISIYQPPKNHCGFDIVKRIDEELKAFPKAKIFTKAKLNNLSGSKTWLVYCLSTNYQKKRVNN